MASTARSGANPKMGPVPSATTLNPSGSVCESPLICTESVMRSTKSIAAARTMAVIAGGVNGWRLSSATTSVAAQLLVVVRPRDPPGLVGAVGQQADGLQSGQLPIEKLIDARDSAPEIGVPVAWPSSTG